MKVQPSALSVKSVTDAIGTRIELPRNLRWLVLLFGIVWLGGMGCAGVALLAGLFFPTAQPKEGKLPLAIFTLVWLAGYPQAVRYWLWCVFGREILLVTAGELVHIKAIGPFKSSREYDLREVSDLRCLPTVPVPWGQQMNWMKIDRLAFDYGAKTHTFGADLDEAQGKHVLAMVNRAREA